jgi:hypothetical protein
MIILHTVRTFSLFAVTELFLGIMLFFAQRIFGITAGSSTFNYMIVGIIGGGTIMAYGIFFNLLKGGKLQWFVRDREMPE